MFLVDVELDVSRFQVIGVSDNAMKLYLKWQETGNDEDFELLVDTIEDAVRDQLEFWIEDITARIVSKGNVCDIERPDGGTTEDMWTEDGMYEPDLEECGDSDEL
jgi:hypothetical protein